MRYKIYDWYGNECFHGKIFEDSDDAEEFLCEKLDEQYDLDRCEYEIEEIKND